MKNISIVLCVLLSITSVYSQGKEGQLSDNKYIRLIPGSENSALKRIELSSDIDTTWNKWKLRGYNYGFNPSLTPMYSTVNGIISTPYMVQVRGNENEKNKKRWGYHVFEGYARDDISRITMLVNKHIEEEKPVAEMYYYGSVYGHSDAAYNWFRIGSDVRQHSYIFSRDKAIFYGSLKLTNVLTLGNIGKDNISAEKPLGDDETNFKEDAKNVNYKELKTSGDGTIFYDKDNHIAVIKINGEWMKMSVEPLPENIKYDFK
jgi:hypothetical protein